MLNREREEMLVLTRTTQSPNNKIMIGDDVVVQIISANGKQIRVGIEAPKHMPILRYEIYDKQKQGDTK